MIGPGSRRQRGRPISLGGSARAGGRWDLPTDAPVKVAKAKPMRLEAVSTGPEDPLVRIFYGRREVGRARLLPAVAGGMEWFWQLHGIAHGYERERTTALQALAVAWSKRAK
jgi:hypothetical protein